MIYQGDNWPAEFRDSLFTHNLHGHQMNRQINRREAGGYNTVHAGRDMFLCVDPRFIGVDLQVGPDGAVFKTRKRGIRGKSLAYASGYEKTVCVFDL